MKTLISWGKKKVPVLDLLPSLEVKYLFPEKGKDIHDISRKTYILVSIVKVAKHLSFLVGNVVDFWWLLDFSKEKQRLSVFGILIFFHSGRISDKNISWCLLKTQNNSGNFEMNLFCYFCHQYLFPLIVSSKMSVYTTFTEGKLLFFHWIFYPCFQIDEKFNVM